ncbi:MFS transporter [Bradyrhizobium algeriense]|uniref:MFS transporter n=1 Tax=Bradyrhizobium algeriense TaxID=634784 RepID=UPI001FCE764E|nr:MFS transporter [Bradyrhizobium algeriense]
MSIVLWLAALGGTSGGFLADWTRRPQSVLVVGCIMFALLMMALPRSTAVIPLVITIGLISALPSGPIMSLPARVLQPETRAIGMGIFYTVYYAAMMLGPAVAGAIAKSTGSAAAAFDFGTAALLACPVLLWGYNRIVAPRPQAA